MHAHSRNNHHPSGPGGFAAGQQGMTQRQGLGQAPGPGLGKGQGHASTMGSSYQQQYLQPQQDQQHQVSDELIFVTIFKTHTSTLSQIKSMSLLSSNNVNPTFHCCTVNLTLTLLLHFHLFQTQKHHYQDYHDEYANQHRQYRSAPVSHSYSSSSYSQPKINVSTQRRR